jgi:class 3 adenylate cyclase/tetratricopeptide (TPR) repeat protein
MKSKRSRRRTGKQQRQPEPTRLCPECGNTLASNGISCTNCRAEIHGRQLQKSEAQQTRPTPSPRLVGEKVLTFKESHEVERKYVTILIADISDYTSIVEYLNPEEQYSVVSHCLAVIREEVTRYGGTKTQTRRGTVKAVFGAPEALELHARRACEAALSVSKAMTDYSAKLKQEKALEFQIRIGLASGFVVSGSLPNGAEIDLEELEELEEAIPKVQACMKPSAVTVAESTYRLTSDFYEFRPLEESEQQEAGKHIGMYELLRSRQLPGPIEAKQLRGLSKFLGREKEISMLLEAAEKTMKGCGQAFGVAGDAGVGKSRLVYEFKNCLSAGKVTWLDGYCRSYDFVPPYQPFLDILKLSFGIKPGEGQASSKKKMLEKLKSLANSYEEILAPLHEMLALTVEDQGYLALSFQEKRKRIFNAVQSILVGETQEKPLIVILEDLHWIDRTSEELLTYLVERISDSRVLLILLYRPEYEGASRLGPTLRQIRLGELVGEAALLLTSSILGGSEVDEGLMALIRNKTGGNPLFIEEFIKALVESAAIQKVDGNFLPTNEVETPLLPKTIQNVISARMDRLAKEVKKTLQVASVIGREFPFRLLERVRKADSNIAPHLERLQQLQFIHEKVSPTDREYIFKHALTQEAAYKGMLSQNRDLIHEEVGNAIEEMFSERIEDFYEQLAYHFSRAGKPQKEIQYLQLSALKASRQHAPWQAFYFYKQALHSLKNLPATEGNKRLELDLLITICRVLVVLNYLPTESEQILKRGEELALVLADSQKLCFFKFTLFIYYSSVGDAISTREYSDYLMTEIGSLMHHTLTTDQLKIIVPITVDRAMSGVIGGRFSETLPLNLRILVAMEETQMHLESYGLPLNEYSLLAGISGGFFGWLGDFENAMLWTRKGLRAALETKNIFSVATAKTWYGIVLITRGLGQDAMEHLIEATQHFEDVGAGPSFLAASWFILGHAKLLTEDTEGAQESMEKALGMVTDSGIVWYLGFLYASLSMVHLAKGDLKSARSYIHEALERSPALGQKHWEGLSKMLQGKILSASELLQAAKAESSILEGIEILTEFGMKPYCAQGYLYLGELYVGTGRTQLAAKNLKKAERMFRQMGMDYWLRKTEGVLSCLQTTQP